MESKYFKSVSEAVFLDILQRVNDYKNHTDYEKTTYWNLLAFHFTSFISPGYRYRKKKKYIAFQDSLRRNGIRGIDFRRAVKAKAEADTKTIESRDGFSLSLYHCTYTFEPLEFINQYTSTNSGVHPFVERGSVIPANEDLFYSYLKPFSKYFKKGAIYNQKKQSELREYVSLTIFAYADLEGNIQTLLMRFHESMPIPFDECVSFYKKMTSGKLKLKIRSGQEFGFTDANYLHFNISLDPKPGVIQKIESAVDLE